VTVVCTPALARQKAHTHFVLEMGQTRRNKQFIGTVSVLSFVAIAVLYIDIGLRGSFDTITNLRVFFAQQISQFTFVRFF
jgi:hypothetical protein